MKYHKINKVEKSVCTCEQKIAYNYAFAYTDEYRKTWKNHKDEYARLQQTEFLSEAVQWCMTLLKTNKKICGKYDIDAIESALRAGMENYLNGNIILTSYEEIGKTFPALYLEA